MSKMLTRRSKYGASKKKSPRKKAAPKTAKKKPVAKRKPATMTRKKKTKKNAVSKPRREATMAGRRLKELSIKSTKELLDHDIQAWQENPDFSKAVFFILGETGNGKTQLIQQVGRELKMAMVEIGLGNALDPTEVTGCRIPVPNKKGDEYTLKLALLNEIDVHVKSGKPFILFIDELGAEQPQMRNFLLKLFAERSLNGVKLEHAYIVCAGNPPGDYKTTPLEPALRARVSIVYTKAKSDEVSDYFDDKADVWRKKTAKLADAYEIVSSFIRVNPKLFGGQDGDTQDMESPARCARAYEFCVHSIYTYGLKNDKPEFLKQTLVGILGSGTGKDLAKFVKEGSRGHFTPDQILNGSFRDPKDHAKWRDAVDNVMAHIANTVLSPSREMYGHLAKFISYGKADAINGFVRELDANKWSLNERVLAKLEAKLDVEGIGLGAMTEEEDDGRASANDAKKTSTVKPTAI